MNKTWITIAVFIAVVLIGFGVYYTLSLRGMSETAEFAKQAELVNEEMKKYEFLKDMYADDYYPNFLVDKGRDILIRLCKTIEARQPKTHVELYQLTHAATEEFNTLDNELQQNDSEIETVARDIIGLDFEAIAKSYGFTDADPEELIATRDW